MDLKVALNINYLLRIPLKLKFLKTTHLDFLRYFPSKCCVPIGFVFTELCKAQNKNISLLKLYY